MTWERKARPALTAVGAWLTLPASVARYGPTGVVLALVLALGATACDRDAGNRERREDTLTSGRLLVAAEPDLVPVVAATARAFEASYPSASISVVARSSRDAMGDVFGNRANVAVIGREIEEVERETATEARIEMDAYRWARDGVALVVHPDNPVNQLSLDDLSAIFSGATTSWADLGGRDRRIEPVVQAPTQGLTQYVARMLLGRDQPFTAAVLAADDSTALAVVRRSPDAIAFVSQSSLAPGVKLLAVSRTRGLPYVELDAETVYRRDYPLTRSFNLVTRTPGLLLGQGFVTFATSEPGQKLVRDFRRVPATVPVRFTRRLPMVSSH